MNLNHLALFRAVAEAGGFTRAAEARRISQPAISAQVAELESSLGLQLFDRLPRGVRLTQAGECLLGYARRLAAVETEAERAMEELRGVRSGMLKLGASRSIGTYWLPGQLAAFHRQHPEVKLEVWIGNTEEVEQQLLEGAVELGLTEGAASTRPELWTRVFHQDELVVIAPPGQPLAAAPLTAAALCREPMVVREIGSGTRVIVEDALRRKRLELRNVVLTLDSPEAIKHSVAAGLGLAIISRLCVLRELAEGTLRQLEVKGLSIPRPLHLVTTANRSRSPAAAAFVQSLDPK